MTVHQSLVEYKCKICDEEHHCILSFDPDLYETDTHDDQPHDPPHSCPFGYDDVVYWVKQ